MRILLLLALLVLPALATADEPVRVYLGANGVWYDSEASPSDFELGGTGRLSLSPHISAVAAAFYGIEHSYTRGQLGGRVTVTDVDNPNFSIGLGYVYQLSSDTDVRPQEWTPEVALGFRPWPDSSPRIVLGASAAYGIESKQAYATLAARYQIGGGQ